MKKIFVPMVFFTSLQAWASPFSCPNGKTYPVSLTFDDGPAGAKTEKVMDILKSKKVKGTFFVLGENFDSDEEKKKNFPILDRMKREGHYIGSHTYKHIAHTRFPSEEAFRNIDKASELLKGYLDPILRLPYGDGSFSTKDSIKKERSAKLMEHIKEEGYSHVGWSVDTNDWDVKKRAYVRESMMKQICENHGGIILFHDIHQNTVDHLESWIDEIQAAGHEIVPLDHFVKNLKPAESKNMPSGSHSEAKNCNVMIAPPSEAEKLDQLIKDILRKTK